MQLFHCDQCGQRLYFENVSCTRCEANLGFLPDQLKLVALTPEPARNLWHPWGQSETSAGYRRCANQDAHGACNWFVPADDPESLCISCRLNETIPNLSEADHLDLWRTLETEKRRLVYALLRLGLPLTAPDTSQPSLKFAFLADQSAVTPGATKDKDTDPVLTGHAEGLITINIKEADPAERERMRDQMDEPYRTLLGHFRHESGHYYWDRLIPDSPWLDECRALFGDERIDYAAALDAHYQNGAPDNWQDSFISSYATMHPWEDWAETWAHYLHIIDTIETAWQFNISIRPSAGHDTAQSVQQNFDPYTASSVEALIEYWLPLTFALNSLNRSMGHEHAYPFVMSEKVIAKLGFVHRVVHGWAASEKPSA